MQLTKDFKLQEFVSKNFYKKWKNNSIWFLDYRIPKIAQFVKDFFSDYYETEVTVHINTWSFGGTRQHSGLRENTSPYFRSLSQHTFGRALDFQLLINNKYIDIKEVYDIILDNELDFREAGITTLENIDSTYKPKWEGESSGWIHADIRWTGQTRILIVNP